MTQKFEPSENTYAYWFGVLLNTIERGMRYGNLDEEVLESTISLFEKDKASGMLYDENLIKCMEELKQTIIQQKQKKQEVV